jgi:hypothetical protein
MPKFDTLLHCYVIISQCLTPPEDTCALREVTVSCDGSRRRSANSVGTLATNAAAKSSMEAQVLRLTWVVPKPQFIGSRTKAIAMTNSPTENIKISWRRLGMLV